MRRSIILLLTVLLMALPVAAQEWPDSWLGDQIEYQEEQKIQMYLENWHDRNPWGMFDMTGHFFYFGSLLFDYCDGENVAVLDIVSVAFRHCADPPWGSVAPDPCYYYGVRSIDGPKYTLTWNEDADVYLIFDVLYWGTNVIALIMNSENDSGIIKMGVMEISDLGVMVWDDNYTHYTYVIEEFTAELLGPRPRRPSGRRKLVLR